MRFPASRSGATTAIKVFISVLSLYLLVRACDLDWAEAVSLIRSSKLKLLALAIAGFPALMAVKAWRWKLLVHDLELKYPFLEAFLSYLAAFGIGVVTPGRVGEFAKGAYLERHTGASRTKAFASVLGDRLFDLVFLLLFGTLGYLRVLIPRLSLAFPAMGFAAFVLCYAVVGRLGAGRGRWRFPAGRCPRIEEFVRAATGSFFSRTAALCWLLTAAAYAVYFSASYVLMLGLNIVMPPFEAALVMAAVSLALLLPLTIAGLGQRETLLVLLLGRYGIDPETALSFSMLHFAVFYLAGGCLGLAAIWTRPLPLGFRIGFVSPAEDERGSKTLEKQ